MRDSVSIIICTKNRLEDLRQTVSSLGTVSMPAGLSVELLVVDNGSTDGTAEFIQKCRLPNMPVRSISEPCPGKSHGLNTALAAAAGDTLLFSDDDLRFPSNWIQGMTAPILSGAGEAVVGGIRLAKHLHRDWMTPLHRQMLASTEDTPAGYTPDLIGANMALSRRVFDTVGIFDTELGPGPAAGGEDTLLSWQITEAGYRIVSALHVIVEHHPDSRRLARGKMLQSARQGSISDAYLAYHWLHNPIDAPRLGQARALARLWYWRVRRWQEWHQEEGIAEWEYHCLKNACFYRHYLQEMERPRNYAKHGFVKLTSSERSTKCQLTPIGK